MQILGPRTIRILIQAVLLNRLLVYLANSRFLKIAVSKNSPTGIQSKNLNGLTRGSSALPTTKMAP